MVRFRRCVELFVVFEFLCQLGLLSASFQHFRVLLRMAAFGGSIVLLFLLPSRARRFHPAVRFTVWIFVILGLAMLNPMTAGFLAGTAQIAMYVAILAPLFWVPRLHIDTIALRRVLLIVWAFQAVSATVGILQVYFPGTFQPTLSAVVMNSVYHGENLRFVNAFGQRVYRPMGLTDYPGGASVAGFDAALLGIAFFTLERHLLRRAAYAYTAVAGITVICLSQVRSLLLMLVVCAVSFVAILGWRKMCGAVDRGLALRRVRIASVVGLLALTAIASFSWAVAVGGISVRKRLDTLTAANPDQVYNENRGLFLTYTVEDLLPRYPLGAGLGRWGMMNHYFADRDAEPPLWSEIQWTAWLYDGGIPLILAYSAALVAALWTAFRIATRNAHPELAVYAALVFAYSLGIFAGTFDANLFLSQQGLNFWLFNALLFCAASRSRVVQRVGGFRPAPEIAHG